VQQPEQPCFIWEHDPHNGFGVEAGRLGVSHLTIKLTTEEVAALKQLVAAGKRGRTSRAVRSDLSRLVEARYVIEHSASMDMVVYVITDLGRRATAICALPEYTA